MSSRTVGELGEFELIKRLSEILGRQSVVVGIGDDSAVIDQPGPEYLLATIDIAIEGVHFSRQTISPFDLGRRVLARSSSDIAAMGGLPATALLSIALPEATETSWIESVYSGLRDEAERFEIAIAGGNISRIDGPIAIDVALLGRVPKDEVVTRKGAEVGDILAVTGTLGDGAAGRMLAERGIQPNDLKRQRWIERYRVPTPRVETARALASRNLVHAMIDLSDGLASDAWHLSEASDVGAIIDGESLPISEETRRAARTLGADVCNLALQSGEDYELLMAIGQENFERAQEMVTAERITKVGRIVEAAEGVTLRRAGSREDLKPVGWRHF